MVHCTCRFYAQREVEKGLRFFEVKTKGKPDSKLQECDATMWEHHCKEAFTDLKEHLKQIQTSQEDNLRTSSAERKANAERIASLQALVSNGISLRMVEMHQRIDRMDRHLWIILAALLSLVGAIVASFILGRS